MKKRVLIIIMIFMTALFLGIIFVPLYNKVICPFKGYNKDMLYNYEDYDIYDKDSFNRFYEDFVEFQSYEQKYETEFFYKHGKNALGGGFAMMADDYASESYSYIIYAGDDYEILKQEILDNTRFIDIPIGYEGKIFISNVDINGTVFYEIYFKQDDIVPEELYLSRIRSDSFLFSYNDIRKEIVFSYMYLTPDVTPGFTDVEDLKSYIEVNLHT